MAPGRRMTVRCQKYIEWQALRKSFAEIAEETGINEKTVRAVAADELHYFSIPAWRVYAPLILGIDEVKVAGKVRGIFTDLYSSSVLDLVESNNKTAIVKWLSALEFRDRLFVVCIDGHSPYWEAVRDVFGENVHIVYDKFHVLKDANHCMHMMKKKFAESEKALQGRIKRRRSTRMLLKRKKNLSEKEAKKLKEELRDAPHLSAAYHAKEEFFAIYNLKTRPAAERALAKWEAKIKLGLQGIEWVILGDHSGGSMHERTLRRRYSSSRNP
jgi:transposase